MLLSKEFLRKLVFWLFENVVALLQYKNQAAAAVIILGMLNFDSFSISNFVWTDFN
jgi:hypothetical protein